ncbi:decaprenyl-phosphate phosphoribosyltransferase [uncultured Pseudokineococcus sp.]|uniref:decaprenyl-phosphate phosphoribosyltransferase n=1 Tax=uncultured Pseudokineococcus sp. TaxID=1642928 RepID=UPI0026237C5A|nr:decaprenyl-phosphate phosphoribosyltransferase [uncultured Pseudokineococcus sp.]
MTATGTRAARREPSTRGGGAQVALGLLRTARPRQWVKNLLVLAAPLAAGLLLEPAVLGATALAFLCFCLAASGIYLVNDARDAEADRAHPVKRHRPVAVGLVPARVAVTTGLLLLVAAVLLAVLTSPAGLVAVIATYVVVQLAYCFFLKHQAVIDLAVVASGFLLRAMAGGLAAGIPLSQWFLLVAAFGSLFMVAGKRYSEHRLVGPGEAATRSSLKEYSESYLRFVWSLSAGVAVTAYGLWAFELTTPESGNPWPALSIAPFVLGLLRYAVDIDRGTAGAPEDIVLGDRVLQVLGVVWVVTIVVGVSVG